MPLSRCPSFDDPSPELGLSSSRVLTPHYYRSSWKVELCFLSSSDTTGRRVDRTLFFSCPTSCIDSRTYVTTVSIALRPSTRT